jgi:hypothetical protein
MGPVAAGYVARIEDDLEVAARLFAVLEAEGILPDVRADLASLRERAGAGLAWFAAALVRAGIAARVPLAAIASPPLCHSVRERAAWHPPPIAWRLACLDHAGAPPALRLAAAPIHRRGAIAA